MISADEARKLVESSKNEIEQEAQKLLDVAIKAACAMGDSQVILYKPRAILVAAMCTARSLGYKAEIVSASHQLDSNYLKVEW